MYKTPKKLNKIDIMGTSVKVRIDDTMCESQGAAGLYLDGTIVLRSEYNGSASFVDTFSHECFHAMCFILGTQLDSSVEEVLANCMGQINVKIINKLLLYDTFVESDSD